MAASAHAIAATTKLTTMAGPATSWAARPVSVKMPAPITTPTPKIVRSSADSDLRSWNSGSSVSAIDRSTDFVRITLMSDPPCDGVIRGARVHMLVLVGHGREGLSSVLRDRLET